MAVIRQVIGETIRATRLRQRRTLRQVSTAARVSLGYLSEIERGQKEPSSELLAAICAALDVRLSDLFAEVSDTMRREEKRVDVARHAAGVMGGNPVGSRRGCDVLHARRLTNPTAAGGRLAPPSGPVQPGTTKTRYQPFERSRVLIGSARPPVASNRSAPCGDRMCARGSMDLHPIAGPFRRDRVDVVRR